jgi:hypothetical protein
MFLVAVFAIVLTMRTSDRPVDSTARCPVNAARAEAPVTYMLANGELRQLKRQKLLDLRAGDVTVLHDENSCAQLDKFYAKSAYD